MRTHVNKIKAPKGHIATQALKKLEQIAPKAPPRDMAQEMVDLPVEVRGAGNPGAFEGALTKKGAETILQHLDLLKKQA